MRTKSQKLTASVLEREIGRYTRQAKSDGGGRGQGKGSGGRMSIGNQQGGYGSQGGHPSGHYNGRVGHGANTARVMFNGIDATDTTRSFTSTEWDQLGNGGHTYVNRERDRLNGGRNGNGNRGGGRSDDRGGRQGAGRVVNEVIVHQQHDGDTSTVTSGGGKSGAGFVLGAHSQGGVAQT